VNRLPVTAPLPDNLTPTNRIDMDSEREKFKLSYDRLEFSIILPDSVKIFEFLAAMENIRNSRNPLMEFVMQAGEI
jgi:hypothetical protein